LIGLNHDIGCNLGHVFEEFYELIVVLRPGDANENGTVALNANLSMIFGCWINGLQLGEESFKKWSSRFWHFIF